MIKINLLPVKKAGPGEKIMAQLYVGVICILLALGVMGYRWYSLESYLTYLNTKLAEKENEKETYKDTIKALDQMNAQLDTLEKQTKALNDLKNGRDWFLRVLDKIVRSVPKNNLWLTEITFQKGKGKDAPETVVIKGRTYNRDYVALFVGNLSVISCPDPQHRACQERAKFCTMTETAEDLNNINAFTSCRGFYVKKKNDIQEAETDLNKTVDLCIRNKCREKCKVTAVTTPSKGQAKPQEEKKEGGEGAKEGGEKKEEKKPASSKTETKKSAECSACENNAKNETCNPEKAKEEDTSCKGKENCVDGKILYDKRKRLKEAKEDEELLHQEEYIVYDDINLKQIKQVAEVKGTLVPIYEFEIEIRPTLPH